VEGLGSPKATPNLDVESRGPNYTTTVVEGLVTIYNKHIPPLNYTVILTGTAMLVTDIAAVLQLY